MEITEGKLGLNSHFLNENQRILSLNNRLFRSTQKYKKSPPPPSEVTHVFLPCLFPIQHPPPCK